MKIFLPLLALLLVSCGDSGNSTADSGQGCTATTTASTTDYRDIIAQSLTLDIDRDGVVNAYDALPFDSNHTVVGNGTKESPFMIYNVYQLTAYIGHDHTGADLADSSYTNKSYLYSTDSFYQVVD